MTDKESSPSDSSLIVRKQAEVVDVPARDVTLSAAPHSAQSLAVPNTNPVGPRKTPEPDTEDSDTFIQQVRTENSIKITLGQHAVGIDAQQSGYSESPAGGREALPGQRVTGEIPLSTSPAAPEMGSTFTLVDATPVAAVMDENGRLAAVDAPVGTSGTIAAVLARNSAGALLYIPAPDNAQAGSSVVQVVQVAHVQQKVKKESRSMYGRGKRTELFPEADPQFLNNYADYMLTREYWLDSFKPVALLKSATEDARTSMRQSANVANASIGLVAQVLHQAKSSVTGPVLKETYDEYRQREMAKGMTAEQLEERRYALIGTAYLVFWALLAMGILGVGFAVFGGSWFALLLWALVVLPGAAQLFFRARQAYEMRLMPFSEWLRSPAKWLPFYR